MGLAPCVEYEVLNFLAEYKAFCKSEIPTEPGQFDLPWEELGLQLPPESDEERQSLKDQDESEFRTNWTEDLQVWMNDNCAGSVSDDFASFTEKYGEDLNKVTFYTAWYKMNCPADLIPPTGNPTLGEDECDEICGESGDCDQGVACFFEICTNPCTGQATCYQEYLQHYDLDWELFDCTEGIVEVKPDCTAQCEYEDCAVERGINPCWKETCDDFCGNRNCSLWFQ